MFNAIWQQIKNSQTMTTTEEKVKTVLKVTEISQHDLYERNKEYNPRSWKETLDRFAAYSDCKFYVALPQAGYEYERYFATYTTPEGIKFFNSVSYSSSLTSNGFCRINIDNTGNVYRILLSDKNGNIGRCENDKANRLIMATNTAKFGVIYSNQF